MTPGLFPAHSKDAQMTELVIRLDKSKQFSLCQGERTPDDPHYRVHFWQGRKVVKDIILLPFDAHGILVPDDGVDKPYPGVVDGKPVMHHPLYNAAMRALVDQMRKKASAPAAQVAQEEAEAEDAIAGLEPTEQAADDVNFTAWLRGEARYEPHILRAAAKTRYHKNYSEIPALVVDLVLDEKLVPEGEVCEQLRRYLPVPVAA